MKFLKYLLFLLNLTFLAPCQVPLAYSAQTEEVDVNTGGDDSNPDEKTGAGEESGSELSPFQKRIQEDLKKAKIELRQKTLAIDLTPEEQELSFRERNEIAKSRFRDLVYGNPRTKFRRALVTLGITIAGVSMLALNVGNSSTNLRNFLDWTSKSELIILPIYASLFSLAGFTVLMSQGLDGRKEMKEGRNYSNLENLITEYIANKHLIKESFRESLEKKFISIEENSSNFINATSYIRCALWLPMELKKDIVFDPGLVLSHMEPFSDRVQDELKDVAKDIAAASPEAFSEVIFHGMKGTGKTFGAKLVGKSLGLPVVTLSLANKSVEDLAGESYEGGNPKPGLLTTNLMLASKDAENKGEVSFKNMILVLEDFDLLVQGEDSRSRETLSFIMDILKPGGKHRFYSPFFEEDIELPRHIVLVSDADLKALNLSRAFNNIAFEGFRLEYKQKMIWTNLIPDVVRQYSGEEFQESDFSDEIKLAVYKLIEADKEPGFETINALTDAFFKESMRNMLIFGDYQTERLLKKYLVNLEKLNKKHLGELQNPSRTGQ